MFAAEIIKTCTTLLMNSKGWDTHTHTHAGKLADAHNGYNNSGGRARERAHASKHTKGAGSTGGHPSYGKHSWTINLISIMVTHERNALPRFMMANWCWYTPNVALINIGRERRTRAAKPVYIIVNEKKQLPLLKVRQHLTEVCSQRAANWARGDSGSARGDSGSARSSPPTQPVPGGTSTCSHLELVWHSLRAPNKLVKGKGSIYRQ